MGNQSSICKQCNSRHLHELCSRQAQNYSNPYQLLLFPFGRDFCPCMLKATSSFQNNEEIPIIDKMIHEGEETGTMLGHLTQSVPPSLTSLSNNELNVNVLQKKQLLTKRTTKHKKIKKHQKPKRAQPININNEAHQLNPQETDLNEITAQQGLKPMRNQNNCKTYHKLYSKFLQKKGLAHLFVDYKVKYHTRYFPVVALIFIKYYLKIDFNEVYDQLVHNELQSQNKKISKLQLQKEKTEEKIKNFRSSSKTYKELTLKLQNLVKKINHLQVVKHEIQVYSTGSCRAFFQGNTQQSLRILYQKDDAVMKKTKYFNFALKIVKSIQQQVRKTTSLTI